MQDQSEESQGSVNQNPIPWFRLCLIGLSIVGATLSLILADIHAQNQLGLIPSATFCGPEDACNSLAVSSYSRFVGIPLAVWGLAFYLGNLALAVGARSGIYNTARLLKIITRVSLTALVVDLALAWIMVMEDSLCFLCLGTYVINLGMVLCAFLARRKVDEAPKQAGQGEDALILMSAVLAALTLFSGFALNHYLGAAKKLQVQNYLAQLRKPVTLDLPPGESLGPKDAKLKMVIFHDFHCGHCRRLRRKARILRRHYPKTLNIRFVNFPFDKQCNPESTRETGACAAAESALFADESKKLDQFIRLSNARKIRTPKDLKELMTELNLEIDERNKKAIQERLKAEIKLGKTLKIRRLPTFFINGYRFEGVPSIEGFSMIFKHIEGRGSSN